MNLKSIAAVAGLFAATLPGAALAVEPQEFANALSGLFAQAEMDVTFESATLQGGDIVLDGVTAAPAGERSKHFDLTILFKNVGETDDGGFTADRATVDRFIFEEDDVSIRLDGLVWENVLFYEQQPEDGLSNIFHESRFFTGPFRVLLDGEEVFRIAYMESGSQADENNQVVNYGFAAQGIRLDLTKIDDEDVAPTAKEFGLSVINMEISAQSQWNVAAGQMDITQAVLDISDVGKTTFGASMLGYDEAFVSALYDLQRTIDAQPERAGEDALDEVALLANGLFLNGAMLRFDDDGITNKLLDLAAEEQGMPRAAMTIGFAAALPIIASELGVSESLQSALLTAASDYMIDPRSIQLVLEPNKPVRFSRLAKAVEDEDAEALIEMFNFNVTANQD